jgi:ABC-type nitrate/sulfonate/bicarbonate transport system substrate-binding protein
MIKRREFLRISGGTLGTVALAGIMAACGDDDDDGTAASPSAGSAPESPVSDTTAAATQTTTESVEPVTIRAAGSSAGMGALMSNALGAFASADGVTVEVQSMSPTDAELAVINGQMDMGLFGILSVVRARDAGHDLVMVAPSFGSHSSLFTAPGGAPASLGELAGARLGVLPRVSAQYTDLLQIAAEQDIDLENDFQLTLGDAQLQEGLFLQGELDAFCSFEPNATRLVTTGDAAELFQFSQEWERMFDSPMTSIGWTTTQGFVDAGNTAERIRAANAALVAELLGGAGTYEENAEFFGLEEDGAIDELASRFGALLIPEWTDDVVENLQFRLDRAAELGLIETAYDVEDLIDR